MAEFLSRECVVGRAVVNRATGRVVRAGAPVHRAVILDLDA
jgi:hypothetical protein